MIEDYDYEGIAIRLLSTYHSLSKAVLSRAVYAHHPMPRKPKSAIYKRIDKAILSLESKDCIRIEDDMVTLSTMPTAPLDYKYATYWRTIYDQGPISRVALRAIGVDLSNAELKHMCSLGVIKALDCTSPLGKPVTRYAAVVS